MKRILFIMAALALVIGLMPMAGVVAGDIGDVFEVGNIAFVPNSGEASVSRVDLETGKEIARYYTAPRENPDPIAWRTSRIALDDDYNAWLLNVGADGTNLQGSVVRVQADTNGLTNTHAYPDPLLPFGTDEAVQVFPVGAPGDMPRAIAIDSEGYIWVGFYSGAQLMKYEYDPAGPSLDVADGPFYPDLTPNNVIRYYDMQFAPDGTLFISSRGSTPPRTPRQEGIWTFDPDTEVFVRETTWDPYALLIAEDGTVYATAYNDLLYIRDKDTGDWSPVPIPGSTQNRGMEFDDHGMIWIASTTFSAGVFGGMVIYSYDIDAGTAGPSYTLTQGTVPVGMGRDAAGNMWAVCRSDDMAQGWLEGFDPTDLSQVGEIQVGPRPYVYRDFVLPMFRICGFKYLCGTLDGLGGWEIVLEMWDEVEGAWVEVDTVDTGPDGEYCFTDLRAGEYRVREILEPGWSQCSPIPNEHLVRLPEGATDPQDENTFYNFENKRIPAVGGAGFPVSRLSLLIPWIALLVAILAGAALLVRRPRKA